jgi:hypothetical protein
MLLIFMNVLFQKQTIRWTIRIGTRRVPLVSFSWIHITFSYVLYFHYFDKLWIFIITIIISINKHIHTHFLPTSTSLPPVANNLCIQITPMPVVINLFHSYASGVQTNITLIYLFCILNDLCVKNVLNTQLIY